MATPIAKLTVTIPQPIDHKATRRDGLRHSRARGWQRYAPQIATGKEMQPRSGTPATVRWMAHSQKTADGSPIAEETVATERSVGRAMAHPTSAPVQAQATRVVSAGTPAGSSIAPSEESPSADEKILRVRSSNTMFNQGILKS
eukprot:scaffold53511_cov49-Tisochrysis_lutea.AAC.1